MNWSLTWEGETYSGADLTGQHLVLIGLGLGSDTWDFDPRSGPNRLVAVLAAFIVIANPKRSLQEVTAELLSASAKDLAGAFTSDD